MQLGIVGLGRMGSNIARRLHRAGHRCVVYNRTPKPVAELAAEGLTPASDISDLVKKLDPPRAVWIMLPAGAITEGMVDAMSNLLRAGDILIDGGNTFYKDDIRRAKTLKSKRIAYVDVGTSGGVWGLERGYCMMIGGPKTAVDRLDPIFNALAPGLGAIARTPGRDARDPRAEHGYIHAGPAGAGHFVKMIHNGIEYGLMQAYAEGFDILRGKADARLPNAERFNLDLADIAEVWRRGSVISSWLLDLGAMALAEDFPCKFHWRGRGFGRRPLDRRCGGRRGGAGERSRRVAVRAVSLARGAHVRRQAFVGDAFQIRRPCRTHRHGTFMTPAPIVDVAGDAEALASRVADFVAARVSNASGHFSLSLSGGSTPKRAYELLVHSGASLDWQKVHLFWGDERFVPPNHRDSNFRMAREALIDHVPIPAVQVHPIPTGCGSPEEAAALYEATLQSFYGSETLDPERPLFDVTLLGLGEDGHTASLFPGTKVLDERGAWVTSVIGVKPEPRISLTYPALESSRVILFVVAGEKKREILGRVLVNDLTLPAACLATRGTIRVFADRAAIAG